jgi:hypothetical protein
MLFTVIPVAVIILGAMIYLALSKKTGPAIRIAALIALGLMVVSVIVCLVLAFTGGPAVSTGPILPVIEPHEKLPAAGSNLAVLFGLIVFLLALFILVAILSLRERKRYDSL